MLLIWGFRSYQHVLAVLTMICNVCGNPAAQRILRMQRKFTLFFVPLFPISTKSYRMCAFCGSTQEISNEQADQVVAQASAMQASPQQQYAPGQYDQPAPQPAYGQPSYGQPAPQTDYFGNQVQPPANPQV